MFISDRHLWLLLSPTESSVVLFVLLGRFVRWEASGRTATVWYCCFQNLFKTACSMVPIKIYFECATTQQYWCRYSLQEYPFYLSNMSHFLVVFNLSIAVHVSPIRMLTFLSRDEILLPRNINLPINFRSLLFLVELALFWLKHLNSV